MLSVHAPSAGRLAPAVPMDPQLKKLIDSHKPYFTVQADGKIKCEINGHCFPPKYEAVAAFVNGSKYGKLKKRKEAEDALTKYEPFVVVSKNFPHMLYCALTGQLLEKSVEAIKKHMKGQRFIRAKERFQEDKHNLIPEMDLGESDGEDGGAEAMDAEQEEGGIWVPLGADVSEGDEDEEMSSEDDGSEEDSEDDIWSGRRREQEERRRQQQQQGGGGKSGRQQQQQDEEAESSEDFEFDDSEDEEEGAAAKQKRKGGAAKAGQKQKQQQKKSGRNDNGHHAGNGAAKAAKTAVEKQTRQAGGKKRNVDRPSAAKKAKRT